MKTNVNKVDKVLISIAMVFVFFLSMAWPVLVDLFFPALMMTSTLSAFSMIGSAFAFFYINGFMND